MASSSSRGEQGDPLSYPDLSAPGTLITSSCRPYLPVCYGNGSTGDESQLYYTVGGTSMAAPHVAGILLLGGVRADGNATCDPDGNPDPIAHR
mgnify:CR=1 FL=1